MNIGGPFSRIDFKTMDLNSDMKIKKYLLDVGWKPTTYNRVKDKDTGQWRTTSPKLTEDSFSSIKDDTGQLVARRNIIKHRRNTIVNFKEPAEKGIIAQLRDDGRVPAQGITCGTPTGRTKHRGAVCNVPKCDDTVVYGCEMRRIFCVPEGYVMIGADLSAIEARIFGHYTFPYDGGAYAKELLDGDIHTNNAKLVGKDRNTAKTFLYAILYGAGEGKLASILGCSPSKAKKLIKNFWEGNKGLKELKENLEGYFERYGYIKGLDGRKIFIRQDYKLLNSLVQTAAGIVFKEWSNRAQRELRAKGLDCKAIISYHDETDYRCCPDDVPESCSIIERTCGEAGEALGLRVPVAADCALGFNWAQVH